MSTTRKTRTAPKPERKPTVKTVRKKAAPKTAAASPADEQIAALAYEIWEQAGRPEGRSDEHWREAEARLRRAGSRKTD